MLDRLDDTIVAVSSGAGVAPVGILRLSGPKAVPIAEQLCRVETGSLQGVGGGRRVTGQAMPTTQVRFPATIYVFCAPRSYTRQDLVEVHTVGSPVALDWLRRTAIAMGAVAAQPGEFTARAFLGGAMDLSAAEGVAGVIRAQTDTHLRASRRMVDGTLYQRVEEVRDKLAELLALVEADIDFAEEPIEFITPGESRERLRVLSDTLDGLLAGAPTQERLDVLPRILLLGAPNAGKSSLMNAVTGTPRAISAPIAGTTRDLLSAPMALGKAQVVLLDAAGVDESEDSLITQARTMTLAAAEHVDLVCLVIDLTASDENRIAQTIGSLNLPRVVVALNKADLMSSGAVEKTLRNWRKRAIGPVHAVSAIQRTGLDDLCRSFADLLGEAAVTTAGEGIALTQRQQSAIIEARDAITRAAGVSQAAVDTIDCADVLAFELREALDTLGAVTGAVTTDDLLARVFANFCIGK